MGGGVNENNNWPSLFSKQPDTEIQAGMNNRKIFNWDHLKTLNSTSNPFFKKTRRNLHQLLFFDPHKNKNEGQHTFGRSRPDILKGPRTRVLGCFASRPGNSIFCSIFPLHFHFHCSRFACVALCRTYSTNRGLPVVPIKIYSNTDLQKLLIIQQNKGKAGVYRWTNLLNSKSYIGSSVNLGKRIKEYFSFAYLETQIKKNKSIIYRSILKNGYSSFSLEIIEYCDKSEVVLREQYYIDLLNPEYNILSTAGSSLGFKHSEETKAKISLGWTEERKAKHLNRLHSIQSHQVSVFDSLKNETIIYPSISEAARAIGVTESSIRIALKRKGDSTVWIKKKRYQITKLSSN